MTALRVAFIHNIIPRYRIPFFERLGNIDGIDLRIYFCARTHKRRLWEIPDIQGLKWEVLPGRTVELGDITYEINPSIVSRIATRDYDAVVIGGVSDFTTQIAFVTCKALNIPVVLWSEETRRPTSKPKGITLLFKRIIAENADSIVVPGSESRNFHLGLGASNERIFTAPNSVDNNLFINTSTRLRTKKNQIKRELGLTDRRIVLSIGQLVERKGIAYLVAAFGKLRLELDNVSLVIVGDGSQRKDLESLVSEKRIEDTHFLGWVSEDEKMRLYSVADVFVLPTLYDVWGLVINEAMASGLPVITTRAAGCAVDMIAPNENGIIVRPADSDVLFTAMKSILAMDEDDVHRMGMMSQERVMNSFNADRMAEGFASAIRCACGRR